MFSQKLMAFPACIAMLTITSSAFAAPAGNCSFEPELEGRSDVLMCEPFESSTWWSDQDYKNEGGLAPAATSARAEDMSYTSIVSSDCLTGKCMKVDTPQGVTRSLSVHWPLINVDLEPDELYFRYYMKIGREWTPQQCDSSGTSIYPASGKLWGFADARTSRDPFGQCGNGGASSDGRNCWSARGVFWNCSAGWASRGFPYDNSCEDVPNARLRIGSYLYVPDSGRQHGADGLWAAHGNSSSLGDDFTSECWRDDPNNPDPDCYCNSTNNMSCGIGSGGQLEVEKWYAIETHIKMNTPGVADGVVRGWVNNVLSYEKRNVLFRKQGHDNLHIRTLWMNTYKGGVNGNCESSRIHYDQLVVAKNRIGVAAPIVRPNPPEDLTTAE